ncbi:MAG: protein translocase subunit SecD [Armatimonadetes bacterium]|nr:protein translocase subunit SecD [Armatimonadota bacterium]
MKTQNVAILLGILAFCVMCVFFIYDPATGRFDIKLGLDLRSGSHIAIQLLETENEATGDVVKITPIVQQRSIQIFENRLNPDGNQELVITPEGADRLIIEIPEMTDLAEAERMVQKVGRLEFKEQVFNPATGAVEWKTVMDGSYISSASARPQPGAEGAWMVDFTLTGDGTRLFGDLTRRLVGKPLGIFFDGNEVSAPEVRSPITAGAGVIEGLSGKPEQQLTAAQEANELANFLNAGALPVKVQILESYTVSPTLGAESLRASLIAGVIGLGAILVYMICYYRLPGFIAGIALLIYSLLVLASMNVPGLKFVLTLPGVAGFILSIGMAVDANVLIFERLKEELWREKSLRAAIDTGFDRAFSSILDGHVTTFIGAAILFWFGAATIKGFGLTLMLGTAWSMITAVFVTRQLIEFVFTGLGMNSRSLYGA